ncbi:hypothetical protein Anacy_4428 [Anabaena cylindrica PCC 7122]|uniref:Uncharacterized protein n=1 Tax=Anabaena cylindrica (strain ATCC 27899 / PCC 7122) TaxID=272123 RepID=K9ZMM9_ANACC|nr:hypothetical protein Anacy_4428 [Anabaena cylindrica PCC 7122]BAY03162.1 hypothetical protein NIES19_24130 [Anabaena cylindrica PCC 7122]
MNRLQYMRVFEKFRVVILDTQVKVLLSKEDLGGYKVFNTLATTFQTSSNVHFVIFLYSHTIKLNIFPLKKGSKH